MGKTPEQKAADAFDKLKKTATDLGVTFTEETTTEELAALVDEAKEKAKADKKAKKSSFTVYNAGGAEVRTYSVETHGKDAEDLAKEFAKKIGGEVK